MKKFFFVLFFLFHTCSADILPCSSIQELIAHTQHDTLFVLDVNAVLKTAQELGSSRWVKHMLAAKEKEGLSREKAMEWLRPRWNKILLATKMKPIEHITPGIVRKLQKNSQILAISTRYVEMAYPTQQQLRSNYFHFERSALTTNTDNYIDGVLFCGPLNSPEAISLFLQKINRPSKIVFFSGSHAFLEQMEKQSHALDINFLSLHYIFPQSNFQPDIADKQWEVFQRVLTEEEAIKLLESK